MERDIGELRDLRQDSSYMRELAREFLTSKSDEIGTWDHGDVGENEDESMVVW